MPVRRAARETIAAPRALSFARWDDETWGGEAPERMQTQELQSLTPLRGIAAIWVICFHYGVVYFDFHPEQFSCIFNKGYLAVDMFFMLSGFVLSHVHPENLCVRPGVAGQRLLALHQREDRAAISAAPCQPLFVSDRGARLRHLRLHLLWQVRGDPSSWGAVADGSRCERAHAAGPERKRPRLELSGLVDQHRISGVSFFFPSFCR